MVNRIRREQLKKARRARTEAHYAQWQQQHGGRYGCGVPGMRYWSLRNPAGQPTALAIAAGKTELNWDRAGIPAGWTTREEAGVYWEQLRQQGLPITQKPEGASEAFNSPAPVKESDA